VSRQSHVVRLIPLFELFAKFEALSVRINLVTGRLLEQDPHSEANSPALLVVFCLLSKWVRF
jgi:hypothetical protein